MLTAKQLKWFLISTLLFSSLSHAFIGYTIQSAQFIVGEQAFPLSQNTLNKTKTVQLPHIWFRDEPTINITQETNGWYQSSFTIKQLPNKTVGVYIRKFNVNAEIFINNQLVKDAGIHKKPLPHYWNTPLYFTVPKHIFKQGINILTVHLITVNDFAMLSEIQLQNDQTLRPIYEKRHFIQNKLSQLIFIFYLFMGSFIFLLWFKRKQDRIFLYLSFAVYTWAISTLAYFVLTPIISDHFFTWLVFTSIIWATSLMVIVIFQYINPQENIIKKIVLIYAVLGTLIYSSTPFQYLPAVHSVYILGSLLFAWFAVARLFLFAYQQPAITSWLISISYLLVQISGIHDWASTTGKMDSGFFYQLQLTGFTSVLFLIVISIEISRRFLQALETKASLNQELKKRINQTTKKLNQQHQTLKQLQNQQAIIEERERIYQDLNEDVGAKIVSLIYRSKTKKTQDLARSALQDLKDVVAKSTGQATYLNQLIANWHAETNQRLESANIELTWQQEIDIEKKPINATSALHLERLLRELISNEIKHNNQSPVTIQIKKKNKQLIIVIEDFNSQLLQAKQLNGKGISNSQYRSQQINASIKWQGKPTGGCKVTLVLPP